MEYAQTCTKYGHLYKFYKDFLENYDKASNKLSGNEFFLHALDAYKEAVLDELSAYDSENKNNIQQMQAFVQDVCNQQNDFKQKIQECMSSKMDIMQKIHAIFLDAMPLVHTVLTGNTNVDRSQIIKRSDALHGCLIKVMVDNEVFMMHALKIRS